MAEGGGEAVERLIELMAKLPGLGPRSARRAVLQMIRKRQLLLEPLAASLAEVAATVSTCVTCGNIATGTQCTICLDQTRDGTLLCVVEDVADLWAIERAGAFGGRYHVLGGVLSALDGIGPEDLGVPRLLKRVQEAGVREVILALNATVDGQTTAHYLAEQMEGLGIATSSLAQGVPIGGELDYLDDGTIGAALRARRRL